MRLYQQFPLFADRSVIRLLELRLNNDTAGVDSVETIEGSVATCDLLDTPDYDALSYAWGPHDLSAHLTLDDELFPVSRNLFAALRQICLDQRKTGRARKLWVDAICINQADNAEKSHQVLLMRDIYSHANMVLAWIGASDNLSALAFDTLEKFAADDGTTDGSATYRQLQDSAEVRRAAVQLIVERGYFIRIWIVQEVVVARKVVILCGTLSLDFDSMRVAIQRVTGSGFYRFTAATANLSYIGGWRVSFHETNAPHRGELLDLRLFLDSRDRMATDPRDKIYSLRGIANKALATRIKVDYSDPVKTVYTDFVKTVLDIRPDLQILSAVILRHKSTSIIELPSYVPDWSLPKCGGSLLQRYYRFKPTHLFHAAGSSTPRVTLIQDSNAISLEGFRLDTISRVIPIKSLLGARDDGSVSVDETILQDLAKSVIAANTYAFSGEPSWAAYFRTLTADRTALSPRIDETYWFQYFASFSDWGLHHLSSEVGDLPASAWELVSKDIGTIIEDKNMFLTTQGYLGLGHEGFDVGDTVCILSGGEVPFILRETAKRENRGVFRFLCECYVHGVMDGEVVDDPNKSPLEEFLIE
ncbi:HET-domain-containing protein [Cadophora sp. DSE1049]|nr:HET-domain-containing protein [Cadophora sp. DSE1049]